MTPIAALSVVSVLFVASHFAMSHPLRARMVAMLGQGGFLGIYSLVSLILLAGIGHLFVKAPSGPLQWHGGDGVWIASSILTIVALALLLGSLRGNPALPQTGAEAASQAKAQGAFAVTRHPMMWGFGLWALAHILAWPSPRTLIVAGALGFLALVGAHLQDGKKARLLGEAWTGWEARTSFWPRLSGLAQMGWGLWLAALALWLALTWVHVWWAGIPAGVWRWIG